MKTESVSCFPKVFKRCKASGSMLDTVDACSLLCRLEMEGEMQNNAGVQKNLFTDVRLIRIRENCAFRNSADSA